MGWLHLLIGELIQQHPMTDMKAENEGLCGECFISSKPLPIAAFPVTSWAAPLPTLSLKDVASVFWVFGVE